MSTYLKLPHDFPSPSHFFSTFLPILFFVPLYHSIQFDAFQPSGSIRSMCVMFSSYEFARQYLRVAEAEVVQNVVDPNESRKGSLLPNNGLVSTFQSGDRAITRSLQDVNCFLGPVWNMVPPESEFQLMWNHSCDSEKWVKLNCNKFID